MSTKIGVNDYTLAIITTDKEMKISGGCPIFYAKDEAELQNKAMLISKCVAGMVHDMTNGTLIIVKH
ncbi:capping complex subunit for YIEGIA [Metaclostridioides mangenotii]|uniref:capping complex subunit for YIEGIA n=1 Tax=Metaclostridioides mangenotii TaxID=1540 RepID=UPI000463986F|nr:hypothetical protein [Clostridioides mangenotii]